MRGRPFRRDARAQERRRFDNVIVREPSPALQIAKRSIDVLGAGFGLIALAPLLIGVAIAIKATSRGPVFFRQKRYGYHNRRFWIFKFRTMYTHLEDQRGTKQTTANDPRITPLGRFLRKTSLDELPQLINVLRGDMSLVGPRPVVLAELQTHYGPAAAAYMAVRPGITGPWQVSGRSDLDYKRRVALDIAYVRNPSLRTDVRILARTVSVVLRGQGAC